MSTVVSVAANMVAAQSGSLKFSGKDLLVIKQTSCPAMIYESEFNQFIHICQEVGLNPLMKQIFCFIFNANNPKKRNMTVVTSIHGLTAIANRTNCYRPHDKRTEFTYSEKDDAINPLGLESAYTGCYVFKQGAWHFSPGEAYWDEYAPIITEVWDDTQRKLVSCNPHLDPKKAAWRKMGRIMLEKCARARAIRNAFPEDCSSLFSEDELARAETIDLTASEVVVKQEERKRIEAMGGQMILIDWLDGDGLKSVPVSEFHGKAMDFLKQYSDEASTILVWKDHNREALRQFWTIKKEEALNLKQALEKIESRQMQQVVE